MNIIYSHLVRTNLFLKFDDNVVVENTKVYQTKGKYVVLPKKNKGFAFDTIITQLGRKIIMFSFTNNNEDGVEFWFVPWCERIYHDIEKLRDIAKKCLQKNYNTNNECLVNNSM